MSSETLVFDATWTEDGEQRTGEYVARVAPSPDEFPVFMNYALQDQYDAMRIVGERTDVPVPTVGLFEPTGEVLGTPFFLMDRIDGVVPPDVPPYNWGDNWLADASVEDQRRLQDNTVAAIAGLHAIQDATDAFAFLDRSAYPGETPLARNLAWVRAWYEWAIPDLGPSPITERTLDWLEANMPDTSGTDTVLCWGDSRIGNVMYRDFAPVGVLDWEMAAIGPREMDVSLDRLRAHGVRVDHRGLRAAGDAALHARGGRQGDVRRAHRRPAGRPDLVPPLQRGRSGAWSSCAPGRGRSTSVRSSGPTTSRPCSTTSR